jgi:hypothetical protein
LGVYFPWAIHVREVVAKKVGQQRSFIMLSEQRQAISDIVRLFTPMTTLAIWTCWRTACAAATISTPTSYAGSPQQHGVTSCSSAGHAPEGSAWQEISA